MSIYSTWSRQVREVLVAGGCKLSHGQAMEVLAAGLGHNSYASFRLNDEASLDSAQFVVVSSEAMQARASRLKIIFQHDQCHDIVHALSDSSREGPVKRHVQRLDTETWLAWNEIDVSERPEIRAMAHANQLIFDGVTVLLKTPNGALDIASDTWTWTATGFVSSHSRTFDFDIPFKAEVAFHKKGRHLMSQGVVMHIEQSGPPVEVGDDYVEGYVSESDL
jgi:hypothetical protein